MQKRERVRSAVGTSVEKGRAERDKNIEPEENVDHPLEPKQRTCNSFQRPPDAKNQSSACESLGWLQLLLVYSCPSPPPKRAQSQRIARRHGPAGVAPCGILESLTSGVDFECNLERKHDCAIEAGADDCAVPRGPAVSDRHEDRLLKCRRVRRYNRCAISVDQQKQWRQKVATSEAACLPEVPR